MLGTVALAQAACPTEQALAAPPLGNTQYWSAYQRKVADEVLQADRAQVHRLALRSPDGGRAHRLKHSSRGHSTSDV